ncbi:translation initiation factor IF-2 subunit gamma [Candidatus Woesearchaeota archaeon]|nr:translation initiation factor IF-2 subunit gamma [Candidatus Woesearchaeota archaeon]
MPKLVAKKKAPVKAKEPKAQEPKAPRKAKAKAPKILAPGEALLPTINIGTVGHVDHGKTTLVKALTGKWTDTHSEEVRRGITIRLGYADATFNRCPKCSAYTVAKECPACKVATEAARTVSFIDSPGHESLMATMLSGATIIDGALLLIAANETCPQPQTREHLMALQICGIKNVVVVQNKVDLAGRDGSLDNYQQIRALLKGTPYEKAPVVPISAQHNLNMDLLISAIEENIPTPERDSAKEPLMYVARSFDINLPGCDILSIHGGVLGGAVVQGIIRKGDTIEVRPGRKVEAEGRVTWKPVHSTVVSIKKGGMEVEEATPGGSVGLMTKLDPAVVKADQLSGSIAGHEGKLPDIRLTIKLRISLLQRVVGSKEELTVEPIKQGEALMLSVNTASTVGIATELQKDHVTCRLKLPVCADIGARVTISRNIANRFRLIGYGLIEG